MNRRLVDMVSQIIIVAHREDVTSLEGALMAFHVPVVVQRRRYNAEESLYPGITKCLLNHRDAWMAAKRSEKYTLVCEADFVPVRDIHLSPADWLPEDELAWAHLYTSSPRLLEPFNGYFRVHQATAVAYLLNANVARCLDGFTSSYAEEHGLNSLAPWDAYLQWYAMGQGARMFMPPKSLGEHGGIANREHQLNGMRHKGTHRADSLAGKLAFEPLCARSHPIAYRFQRLYFRLAALGKVIFDRWIVEFDEGHWSRAERRKSLWRGITRLF
jgi:hypothetical protein